MQALVLEVHSDEGVQFGGGIGGSCCTRGSRHKSRPRRNGENSAVRDFEGSEVADSMEASSEGRAGSPQRRAEFGKSREEVERSEGISHKWVWTQHQHRCWSWSRCR